MSEHPSEHTAAAPATHAQAPTAHPSAPAAHPAAPAVHPAAPAVHPAAPAAHPAAPAAHPAAPAAHKPDAHNAHNNNGHAAHPEHEIADGRSGEHEEHGHDGGHGHGHGHGGDPRAAAARAEWQRENSEIAGVVINTLRDFYHATIGNIYERGKNLVLPVVDTIRTSVQGLVKSVLHPIDSFRPFSSIGSIITGTVRAVKNTIGIIPALIDNAYKKGIEEPVKRIREDIKAKSPIGKALDFTAKWGSKIIGVVPFGLPNIIFSALTKWIDKADDYSHF